MLLDYVNTGLGYDLVLDSGKVLCSFPTEKLLLDYVRNNLTGLYSFSDKLYNSVYGF